jgi:hypothetical protein
MTNPLEVAQRRGPGCPSDLMLDRLRLGELQGAAEGERATRHVAECTQCQGRLAALAVVVAPAIDFGPLPVTAPRRASRSWRRRGLWLTPLLAAAAVAALIPWGKASVRSKGGGWQLGVVAQRADGRVSRVSPGEALLPGDRLRFEVAAPADAFVAVISLDGRGAVTPFVPATGNTTAIGRGTQLLDGAVRLDDALGPERIMLLGCPDPMPVADLVAAGRAALARAQGAPADVGRLDLPCTQTSFWIRKEARP